MLPDLLPLFLNLSGRDVVLVGGGRVAAAKLRSLLAAGARVRVVAPAVTSGIDKCAGIEIVRRAFTPVDLDGAWLVVAAATPEVNREVAAAAEVRRVFVNAVDDPANASAFLSGTIRRGGATIAISTNGEAPALTSLVREALDALLPRDLDRWVAEARRQRKAWRRDRVPMEARKPRLLEVLNRLYQGSRLMAHDLGPEHSARDAEPSALSPAPGHVSLVGAGPGDPALATRKAIARLRSADLVLYDALIDDRLLRYARKAQRFFVGKRAGRHAISQDTIHMVMIRAARRGRRVVRLKGGDPFVFGRGGEEALALERAGVPFDIVPGVTSAVAAPALAGIPLTYRGLSSAFLVVSGHDLSAVSSALDRVDHHGLTLVVLMGMGRHDALARTVMEHGWGAATPAALVVNASKPNQRVWRGTLQQLATGTIEASVDGPGTIVIGDVVLVTSHGVAPIDEETSAAQARDTRRTS